MEDTNPQGSAQTVDNAAAKIFGMLEPEQPEGQAVRSSIKQFHRTLKHKTVCRFA